ncbi:class I SAM-dependent methyltransferase [Bacillus sp. SM2101]|uniref:class I SAM-dependent methyltransferase n=1 Tax=Bacillus sp. SM2101 TaxID=2805366 RepID=UPI001BDE94DA|nr:class I SAM-dependent methyltransferase [Bacillus sp. SM2101]
MSIYGNELFKGAASYYSKYRPTYSSSLIRFLVNKFSLNGEQQLLDLGCGTGHLTIRFSDWCNKIVAIDIEPEMIAEAQRLHKEIRFGNIQWFKGTLKEYKQSTNEKFELVTIAKAFHWMDRKKVLEELFELVSDAGGVAIIDNYAPHKKLTVWQEQLDEVKAYWYGKERRAGNVTYSHPKESHEEVIANSKFKLENHLLPTYEIHWTVESILGNLYSTSYGSKRFLGNNVEAFERDLKKALLEVDESGIYKEKIELSVKLGIKSK